VKGLFTTLLLARTVQVVLAAEPGSALPAPVPQGSALEARLNQDVSDYTLNADNFLQALTRIAAEFRIPMGIVLVGNPQAERGVKMSWHQVTVREGLRLLVQSYPGYDFDSRGDVLHVYATDIPADEHDFLSVTIPSFDANTGLMSDDKRLRETVNRMVVPDGHAHFSKQFVRGAEQYRKFKAENATVREILDKLLLASDDYKIWLTVYPDEISTTRTGFRKVISPFDFKPILDEDQPVWAIFLWGYDPVAHVFNFDWLKGATGRSGGNAQ
jgi:hypothetical protein